MNSADKRKTIFFIWGAFVLAALFTFAGDTPNTSNDAIMALFYVLAVLLATRFILYAPGAEAELPKAKHENISHLLSSMSDEEVDALRQRLSDDGELTSSEVTPAEAARQRKGQS